jgi:hypothetical protein
MDFSRYVQIAVKKSQTALFKVGEFVCALNFEPSPQIVRMEEASLATKTPKMRWTAEEDRLLIDSVETHGTSDWSIVARDLPHRNGKQCRERWTNQLNPGLKLEVWAPEEDRTLIGLAMIHGHQWALIAHFLHGRSVTSTKNRFSYLMRHFSGQIPALQALAHRPPPLQMQAPVLVRLVPHEATPAVPQRVQLPPISVIELGAQSGLIPQLWL